MGPKTGDPGLFAGVSFPSQAYRITVSLLSSHALVRFACLLRIQSHKRPKDDSTNPKIHNRSYRRSRNMSNKSQRWIHAFLCRCTATERHLHTCIPPPATIIFRPFHQSKAEISLYSCIPFSRGVIDLCRKGGVTE